MLVRLKRFDYCNRIIALINKCNNKQSINRNRSFSFSYRESLDLTVVAISINILIRI